jgi:PRC-barrel domain
MPVKPLSPRVRQRLPSRGGRPTWLLEVDFLIPGVDPERLLAECTGFLVDDTEGRALGVVDGVQTNDKGLVTALRVATGWFGRRKLRVPVDAIDSLVPQERRVIVREAVPPESRASRQSR